MKLKVLLLGAVITVFTFTSFAADALLSPRAAGNQTTVVPGITVAQPVSASAVLLSPRAAGNQTATVTGAETFAVKCPVLGSPKYITAAGPAARTSCCNLTLAECATMDKMPN
jgi:hypothetical protein